jgi:histidinol-phosphate aminotransferase
MARNAAEDPIHEDGVEGLEPYLNLGLNDGTYMPAACIEVLQRFAHRTGLRHYTSSTNRPLLDTICRLDGVQRDNIFLHNGSGPILKQVVPWLIRDRIQARPARVLRHLVSKTGYPIVTPTLTYGKVPKKAMELGLRVEMVEVKPEEGFKLDADQVAAHLARRDGFLYVVNPNNPSGNMMLTRAEIQSLVERFPGSTFWVDEAYLQYAPNHRDWSVSDLVPRYPNLFVSRTMSFAYGLAGIRVGYLLGPAPDIAAQEKQLTDYRLGELQEAMTIAALEDKDHLSYLHARCEEGRRELTAAIEKMGGIQVFPSLTNFILCRFKDGRKAEPFAQKLEARGIHIKTISAFGLHRFDDYFRLTLGLPEEHARLLREMEAALL